MFSQFFSLRLAAVISFADTDSVARTRCNIGVELHEWEISARCEVEVVLSCFSM